MNHVSRPLCDFFGVEISDLRSFYVRGFSSLRHGCRILWLFFPNILLRGSAYFSGICLWTSLRLTRLSPMHLLANARNFLSMHASITSQKRESGKTVGVDSNTRVRLRSFVTAYFLFHSHSGGYSDSEYFISWLFWRVTWFSDDAAYQRPTTVAGHVHFLQELRTKRDVCPKFK